MGNGDKTYRRNDFNLNADFLNSKLTIKTGYVTIIKQVENQVVKNGALKCAENALLPNCVAPVLDIEMSNTITIPVATLNVEAEHPQKFLEELGMAREKKKDNNK